MINSMNIFVLNYFFFGFSTFLISFLILLKRGDEIARRWFYFSILVTIWAIFYAFEVDNKNSAEFALYSARMANACSAVIPLAWLYFLEAFLEIKIWRIFWILASFAAIFLLASAPTDLFIPAVSSAKNFIHISEPGPIFHLQAINFFCIVSFGFFLIVRFYLKEQEITRKREIGSLFLATALGFTGGASNYSIIYLRDKGIDLTFLLSSYPFLMAYAMIKHRALDPEKIANAFHREKLAAIGLLAASINHEIKSPLYVIKSQAEIFLENLKEGSLRGLPEPEKEAKLERVLTKTIEQSTRIFEIMKRLTEFSKPALNTYMEKANLHNVLENVLSFMAYSLRTDNVSIEKILDPGLTVQANLKELEQIFLNLIANAYQALNKKAGSIKIEAEERKGKVGIRITDSGPGIPSQEIKKIFEPFYTTKSSGTGLGLYITKQLVERNGGHISVQSNSGSGTTVTLEFKQ